MGLDTIDREGHERWDSQVVGSNEFNLEWIDEGKKKATTDLFDQILCEL